MPKLPVNESVLDSSVILALLRAEPVPDGTLELVSRGIMSTVNVAEVFSKLSELSQTSLEKCEVLLSMLVRVEPFTLAQARVCGDLRARTKEIGLSVGDRSCLALALELGAEVYTCDRIWAQLDLGIQIHLLR